MNARERRRSIMAVLERAKDPVSGSALAREVGVSRQVVVQDIALLRADGHDIVATNRGYVLPQQPRRAHASGQGSPRRGAGGR